jgi:hypothetical protein
MQNDDLSLINIVFFMHFLIISSFSFRKSIKMKFFVLIFSLIITSYSVFAQKAELVGRWEAKEGKEHIILVFDEDDSGTFDGMAFTYVVEGDELIATFFYGIFHYKYEFISDKKTKYKKLSLSEGNLEHSYAFDKKIIPANGVRLAIKETDTSLLGTWEDEKHKVTFKEDGTVLVNETSYMYKTKRGIIKLYKGDSMTQAAYSVFQTTLAMAIDDEVVQLKRQK